MAFIDFARELVADQAKFDAYIKESYDRGVESGANWDAPWTPGGPWVHKCNDFGREPCPCHTVTKAEAEAWLKGWHDAGGEAKRDTTIAAFKAAGKRVPY